MLVLYFYGVNLKPLRCMSNKSSKENKLRHQKLATYFARELMDMGMMLSTFSIKKKKEKLVTLAFLTSFILTHMMYLILSFNEKTRKQVKRCKRLKVKEATSIYQRSNIHISLDIK